MSGFYPKEEDFQINFGKYSGKRPIDCYDPEYWKWVMSTDKLFSRLGKLGRRAVRRATYAKKLNLTT